MKHHHVLRLMAAIFLIGSADAMITAQTGEPKLINTNITFNFGPNGGGRSYTVNFGDGTGSVTQTNGTFSKTWSQAGRFIVSVILNDNGTQSFLSFRQSIHLPTTANKPTESQSILYESRGANLNDRVWNVNPDNNTVSVVNALTNAKVGEIGVGASPRSLCGPTQGRIWVTNKEDATIYGINPTSFAIERVINLPLNSAPHGIVASPDGIYGYVALEGTGEVAEIHFPSSSITTTLSVGTTPRHISINHNGTELYASEFITPRVPGEQGTSFSIGNRGGLVYVVNTAGNLSVSRVIRIQRSVQPDSEASARGLPNYLGPLSVSPDNTQMWITSKQDNIERGQARDGLPLVHDRSVRTISSRVANGSGLDTISRRVDHDNAGVPSTTTFSPEGSFLYTALEGNRGIEIVDAHGGNVITRFFTDRAPQGLAISPSGLRIYVHNFMSRTVTAFNLSNVVNGTGTSVPRLATIDVVANESLSGQVLLGKQHFYDALDTRLSLEEYMSCTSCHSDGGHDGRTWDFTQFGEGVRNTTDLRDRAGMAHGRVHWSANFDEIQDFENQIRSFSGGTGLMADADFNATQPVLGPPKAGRSADLDALAAYVASLAEAPASPHRPSPTGLTASAQAGQQLFASSNCSSCHSGTHYTDSPQNLLHDIGTLDAASGQRLGQTLTGIDTPGLRGVWAGAPYLHDGAAATLQEAILAHTSNAVGFNVASLSNTQLNQLADYLRQLDEVSPDAPTGGGSINMQNVAFSLNGNNVCVTYTNATPFQLNNNYMLFIDTDQNPNTGYSVFGQGADILVRANQVFAYTGNGSNWSWNALGNATVSGSGSTQTLCFPTAWLNGANTIKAVFFGDNSSTGGSSSIFPANANASNAISFNVNGGGGIVIDADITDWPTTYVSKNDPADADAIDVRQLFLYDENSTVYGFIVNEQNIAYNDNWFLWFDTDQNQNSGYKAWGVGAEFMLRGNTVYEYTGSGTNWSWNVRGNATVATNGTFLEWGFPRAWINNASTWNYLFFGSNPGTIDLVPNGGIAGLYSSSGGGANLVANPGFENGFNNWSDWGNNSYSLASNPNTGNRSMAIGPTEGGSWQQLNNINPGDTLTATAFAYRTNLNTPCSFGIFFDDANGNQLSAESGVITSTSYSQVSISATAPANTQSARIWFWKNNASNWLIVDDVSVTK